MNLLHINNIIKKNRFILASFLMALEGCGVLIGNVKPVEEKAKKYSMLDLSRDSQDGVEWTRIIVNRTKESTVNEISQFMPDSSFQSSKTNSIISINSTCRVGFENSERNLGTLTQGLLFGITHVVSRESRDTTLSGLPALETTVEGQMASQPTKIRVVVFKISSCIFDVMFVARPNYFKDDEGTFERFKAGIQLVTDPS